MVCVKLVPDRLVLPDYGGGAGGVVVALDASPWRGLGAHEVLLPEDPASLADPSQACF